MPSASAASGTIRRRILLDDSQDSADLVKTLTGRTTPDARSMAASVFQSEECARLITTSKSGHREVWTDPSPSDETAVPAPILLRIKSFRMCTASYMRKTGLETGSSEVANVYIDLSTNGVILNGHRLRKTAGIVMDGDEIQIPNSQKFKCVHVKKEPRERMNIFEPTPPQGTYKNLRVGAYTVMSHCLGSGSFASVHLAFDSLASRQVACKTIIARTNEKGEIQKIMKEVNILRGLKHPNISRVLDVDMNERNGWLHIFLELCTGGDLFSYISHRRLDEEEARYIMYQIFKGIEYLHDRSIAHRGEPENILLVSPGPYPRVQIADFGLARPKSYQETMTVCGTVGYLPPEGILALDNKELGYVGMPADCWSAGVIIYTILSGSHPFDYRRDDVYSCDYASDWQTQSCVSQFSQSSVVNERVIKARIVEGAVNFSHLWDDMPDGEPHFLLNSKILVEGLLIHDYTLRETVQGALRSRWFAKDELQQVYDERICRL
ncbi:kinase-like protein [Phellopilus nigrolimitatus]|nr:kinase-like protein [Phellopilus nigrolimitatus]